MKPALIDIVRALPPRGRTGGTVALMAATIIEHHIATLLAREAGTSTDALFAVGFTAEEIIEHAQDAIAIVTDPLIAGLLPSPQLGTPAPLSPTERAYVEYQVPQRATS